MWQNNKKSSIAHDMQCRDARFSGEFSKLMRASNFLLILSKWEMEMVEVVGASTPVRILQGEAISSADDFSRMLYALTQRKSANSQTYKEKDTTLENSGAGENGFSGNIQQHGDIPGGLIIKHEGAILGDLHVYGANTTETPPEGAKIYEAEWNKDGSTLTLPLGPLNGPIYVQVKNISGSGTGEVFEIPKKVSASDFNASAKKVAAYFESKGLDPKDPNVYNKLNIVEASSALGQDYANVIGYYNETKPYIIDDSNGKKAIKLTPNEETGFRGGKINEEQTEYNAFISAFRLYDANKIADGNDFTGIIADIKDGMTTLADINGYFTDHPLPATDSGSGYIDSMNDAIGMMNDSINYTFSDEDGPVRKVFDGIQKLKDKGFSDDYINSLLKDEGGINGFTESLNKYASEYVDKVGKYIDGAVANLGTSRNNEKAKQINAIIGLVAGLFSGGSITGSAIYNLTTATTKNIGKWIDVGGNAGWTINNTYQNARTLAGIIKETPKDSPIVFNGVSLNLNETTRNSLAAYAEKLDTWVGNTLPNAFESDDVDGVEVMGLGDDVSEEERKKNPHPEVEGYSYTWYAENTDGMAEGGSNHYPLGWFLVGIKA